VTILLNAIRLNVIAPIIVAALTCKYSPNTFLNLYLLPLPPLPPPLPLPLPLPPPVVGTLVFFYLFFSKRLGWTYLSCDVVLRHCVNLT
jgi:hypothetical protein